MEFRALACAEFPNDNPQLHRGAIWYCEEVTAAPVFERGPGDSPAPVLPVPDAPAAVEPVVNVAGEPPTDPTPPVVEADDETDDIEIVEDLAFDEEPIEEAVGQPVEDGQPVEQGGPELVEEAAADPFAGLVRILEDVVRAADAGEAALTSLRVILGQLRIDAGAPPEHVRMRAEAQAWQGILRGESEDFGACGGGMHDEWAAGVLALATGAPARAESFKRELRRRGVAAFGLVEQAA